VQVNVPLTRIATFRTIGTSEEELWASVLQLATDLLKPYIPEYFEEMKSLDTVIFLWKRNEIYVAHKVQQIAKYMMSVGLHLPVQEYAPCCQDRGTRTNEN
jgi:hypothetical protein